MFLIITVLCTTILSLMHITTGLTACDLLNKQQSKLCFWFIFDAHNIHLKFLKGIIQENALRINSPGANELICCAVALQTRGCDPWLWGLPQAGQGHGCGSCQLGAHLYAEDGQLPQVRNQKLQHLWWEQLYMELSLCIDVILLHELDVSSPRR